MVTIAAPLDPHTVVRTLTRAQLGALAACGGTAELRELAAAELKLRAGSLSAAIAADVAYLRSLPTEKCLAVMEEWMREGGVGR